MIYGEKREKNVVFFKGRKEKGMSSGSLETSVSICHQVSEWGQWEGYKEEGGGGVGRKNWQSLVTQNREVKQYQR